jgi:hypothetical protein
MDIIRLCSDDGHMLATGNAFMWRNGLVEAVRTGIATYVQKGNDEPVNLAFPHPVTIGQLLTLGALGTDTDAR